MNPILSIELAHQHQRDLLDDAAQSRTGRATRTRRPSLGGRFLAMRRARSETDPAPASKLTVAGTCAAH